MAQCLSDALYDELIAKDSNDLGCTQIHQIQTHLQSCCNSTDLAGHGLMADLG